MATKGLVEELDEFLTCTICYNHFEGRNPRILNCHHAFCLECLQDVHSTAVLKHGVSHDEIQCPSCQETTSIKDKSVADIPPYFHGHQILDILKKAKQGPRYVRCMICREDEAKACCLTCARSLCGTCNTLHGKNSRFQSHICVLCPKDEMKMFQCPDHPEIVESFCTDCYTGVCKICLLSKHGDHECRSFSFEKIDVNELEKLISDRIDKARTYIDSVSTAKEDINTNILTLKDKIEGHRKDCYKLIDDQINGLYKRLEEIQTDAHYQLDFMKRLNSDVLIKLEEVEGNTIKMKNPITGESKIYLQDLQHKIDQLDEEVRKLKPLQLCHSDLSLSSETTNITTGNLDGSILKVNNNIVSSFGSLFNHDMQPEHLLWRVDRSECRSLDVLSDGKILTVSGKCQGQIKIHNAAGIEEMVPFDKQIVKNPIRAMMHKPSDTFAIMDQTLQSITVFKENLKNWNTLQLKFKPLQMAFMNSGDIIITGGQRDNTLNVFNTDGICLQKKVLPHSCYYPTVDKNNHILISDLSKIHIYNEAFERLHTIGDTLELSQPRGMCVDSKSNILVADRGKKAVLLFNDKGNFIRKVLLLRDQEQHVHIGLYEDMFLLVGSMEFKDITMYHITPKIT